jgi:hypothetical protein
MRAHLAPYSRRAITSGHSGATLPSSRLCLILFTIGLFLVGATWFALWLVYLLFVIRYFPEIQAMQRRSKTHPDP